MSLLIDRRSFLRGAGLAFASGLAPAQAARLANSDHLFVSAYKDTDGVYGVAILDKEGALVSKSPLPGRGHGFASTANSEWLVAFARRPGNFAVAFDKRMLTEPFPFHSPADRHFYGHGAFSSDGRLLYAAENDFDVGDGMIGVYDATGGFARIGEFPSYGIGPHEILMMPDGETLCIANGGIRTHPDYGRQKLNLASMKPSIAFVRAADGALVSNDRLPYALNRLSLRHMAVDARSRVWIGGQYQGDKMDEVPVLARLDGETGLTTVELPADVDAALNKYIGSVAVSADGAVVALSSPKAGVIVTIEADTAGVANIENLPRTCGVQASGEGFISSSETGRFARSVHPCAWDNHIAIIR